MQCTPVYTNTIAICYTFCAFSILCYTFCAGFQLRIIVWLNFGNINILIHINVFIIRGNMWVLGLVTVFHYSVNLNEITSLISEIFFN